MTSFFAKTAIAALISFAAISSTAATASAGGVDVKIQVGAPGYYHGGYRHYNYRGHCKPWMALDKARWRGLHRARIAHVGPNRIVVEGRKNYHWNRITFANARGCPVIHR